MKDENRTGEMIDILEEYQKYVPTNEDGSPKVTVLYGDGLSCERAASAQGGRLHEGNEWMRLEGLHVAAQDWHLRLHMLEVKKH